MASLPLTIPILFVPILEKLCTVLDFPKPIYNCVDVLKNVAYVLVQKKSIPTCYTFVGDESSSVQASCESAARKMAVFLVRKYKVVVKDINLALRSNAEQCIQLYKTKRTIFDRIEKDLPALSCHELVPVEGVDYSDKYVEIDFLEVLRKVVVQLQIGVTPIEVDCFEGKGFTSWFTIALPKNMLGTRCVIGDKCSTIFAAKQSLAKKAITLMMHLYHFEVEDINYHFLEVCTLAYSLERESYLAIKERIHGLNEDKKPFPCVVEQDQITPQGERNRILAANNAPLPPKKRTAGGRRYFSDVIPDSAIPPELLTVKKRPRHA